MWNFKFCHKAWKAQLVDYIYMNVCAEKKFYRYFCDFLFHIFIISSNYFVLKITANDETEKEKIEKTNSTKVKNTEWIGYPHSVPAPIEISIFFVSTYCIPWWNIEKSYGEEIFSNSIRIFICMTE